MTPFTPRHQLAMESTDLVDAEEVLRQLVLSAKAKDGRIDRCTALMARKHCTEKRQRKLARRREVATADLGAYMSHVEAWQGHCDRLSASMEAEAA